MAEISVTFEDGASERFPAGTTAGEALRAHAERRRQPARPSKRAVAARVERHGADGHRPRRARCRATAASTPVAPDSPEGLDVLRHSTRAPDGAGREAALPGDAVTIGPVIEHGFYYDFKRAERFTPEDLDAHRGDDAGDRRRRTCPSRARSCRAPRRSRPSATWASTTRSRSSRASRRTSSRSTARASSSISAAGRTCRRPGDPGAFKLTSVAGAYWRGDEQNEMLQRIYGTAWATQKELEAHLEAHRGGEAARPPPARRSSSTSSRSTRSRPGSPFFHPKGARRLQRAGRLHPQPLRPLRLQRGHHAADLQDRALEDVGALRALPRQHVPHGRSTRTSSASSR